jgi:dTDP-4-amino-4,6-dideoxygalactose transaminase
MGKPAIEGKGMIPRFKPYLGKEELLVSLRLQEGAVRRFEEAFARTFEASHAVSFPYGRSGLWAFFKAFGIEQAEVIMPAYTCVTVAHATVLSDNIPRFVDITLHDYNMDLDKLETAINEKTRAIIATHLFGYPLNLDQLGEIIRAAETRLGQKIWVIQDCAHAFGATWQGKLVCNQGDMALYGLNISKTITSIFGGMITTNDSQIHRKLLDFRNRHFVKPGLMKRLRRFFYLLAVYPAFNERVYGLVNWLQQETTLLDRLTKAYHLDEHIHFPPDYLDLMIELESKVGLAQLLKYPEIVRRRRENASYYDQNLREIPGLELPPLIEGATYSHYAVRVPDRDTTLRAFRCHGIQLGEVIQYSVPHMVSYLMYAQEQTFPNSWLSSRTVINLPIHADLSKRKRARVTEAFFDAARQDGSLPRIFFPVPDEDRENIANGVGHK